MPPPPHPVAPAKVDNFMGARRSIATAIGLSVCLVACSGQRGDGLGSFSLEAGVRDAALPSPVTDGAPAITVAAHDAAAVGTEFPGAVCGNGITDPGEECDDGTFNSNSAPNSCRLACTRPRCGDGVVDTGEVCDEGANNSDGEPNACRTACVYAGCGDNVVDPGEECDTGSARSDTEPSACRTACRNARCGDGVKDNTEGCDDGNANNADACGNLCTLTSCGDGVRNLGEDCDDGNLVNGDGCQATCRLPRCGDGVRDPGEQCDDGNTANNDGCRTDCTQGCTADGACDDKRFCNGMERCVDGKCVQGTQANVDDSVSCTIDSCSDAANGPAHMPSDALCGANTARCSAGSLTTSTPHCDATRGCTTSTATMACADQASTCAAATGGGYTLTTYTPACSGTGQGCAPPMATQIECSVPRVTCEGGSRQRTLYAATCDATAERCGQRIASTESCAVLDRAYCAAGAAAFVTERGFCDANASCATAISRTPCTAPATICTNPASGSPGYAKVTTYTASCNATTGCSVTSSVQTCTQGCIPADAREPKALQTGLCNAAGNGCETRACPNRCGFVDVGPDVCS
jgi:cysteine-rich repeat protein